MKNKILTLLALSISLLAKAQNECVVPMMVLVPEQTEAIGTATQIKLESKMRQIITKSGMEGSAEFSNFCLVANIIEGTKEVTSGLRPLITVMTDLELFVGNTFTGEKFAATTIALKGAGNNEAKAYSAAFNGISAKNENLQKFLSATKNKILNYYDTQMSNIVAQANALATKREYEEALCLLTSVPTCSNKYDEAEKAMFDIYQQYVDFDCEVKVNKARAIWNANQDKEAANLAGAYLASIDPASSCREEALQLAETIRQRIGDDWEFAKELQRDAIMLEKAKIEAIRAIGVAYGQNQKSDNIRENWIVR